MNGSSCLIREQCRRLLSVILLSLIVAGCYGNTRPIVKIGLIAPFEDLYRSDGYAALYAVRLAVAERNAAGGVAGHQVALVALNDNGRPAEAAMQAAKLGVDADVVGVIGPLQGTTVRAAAFELADHHLPWIALTPPDAAGCQGGFSLSAPAHAIGEAAMAALISAGVSGPVAVFADSADARAGAEAQARAAGLPVSVRPVPEDPATALSDDIVAAVWLGDAAGGARLAQSLQGGRSPALYLAGGPELASPVFSQRAAGATRGAIFLSSGPAADDLPASFVTAFEELAGVAPGPQAVLAYDAAVLLLDAMDQAASLGRDAVYQAVRELGDAGWSGLSGQLRWTEAGLTCQAWRDAPLRIFPSTGG